MAFPLDQGGGSLIEAMGTTLETEQKGQGLGREQAYGGGSAELWNILKERLEAGWQKAQTPERSTRDICCEPTRNDEVALL